ncbi:two-component response regulator-like APRR3 isoform X1, partial [Micractinium conductrix]
MPELNGLQLLNCVKSDANLRAVPVMMSSLDQQETVAAAVQNGAEEYLVKPVTRKEVQHIWQHVWRKRCAAAPVPQLPQEAAAAMAAATAVVAASEQHASQQQQQQQDVQQPATASLQQGAQQLALPQPGTCVVALIRSSPQAFAAGPAASLQQRQAVFFAAVATVQAAHLQQHALLCLRPSRLLFSPRHGLSMTPGSASTAEVDQLQTRARRPTVHALLRSGLVADAFRLVAQLPHWRVLAAAPAASTAAAPKAAAPKAAPAAPAPGGPVDHEAVRHFLLLLRKSKQQEFVQAQAQLAALESDLGEVAARRRSRSSSADGARGGGEAPGSKRPRMSMEAEAAESESEDVPLALMGLSEEQQARL